MKTIIKELRRQTMRTTTVLSLILMLVLLAGCGGGSEPPVQASQSEASAQTGLVAQTDSIPSQNETSTEADSVSSQSETSTEIVSVSSQNETSTETDSVPTQNEASTETGSILNEDYPDALPIRNQLNLGTLRLEEDPELAITPKQAADLLMYWQALSSVLKSGTGASAEIDTLQAQIQNEMTPEQLQAIAAMKLSRADMQAVAKELGVNTSGMQSMMNQNLSDDERATRRAQRAASGQQGPGVLLMDQLIELLAERAD
jgi:hypothetical protein